ncbi:MAG: hypothetical protein NTZ26_06785 [Candidatus Aminicenantes bacterium]|nr:hypothetical protein [Candidatus Aminicenantes bacterium]
MKKSFWIISAVLVMAASSAAYLVSPAGGPLPNGGSAIAPGGAQYSNRPQEYGRYEDNSYFYDRLSAYGDWIDLNPYGYVWIPRHMGYRWRPYSYGRWVWSDYGWTWLADEEWGDIPFHYGRWGWDEEIGWFWVPDTVWGPAWVTWRSNDQYMGWAPLPPGFEFRVGMRSVSLAIRIPLNFWVFIQGSHFQDSNLNGYLLPYERNQTIVNYTTLRNNLYTRNDRIVNEGFGLDEVRRITGRAVPTYSLQDVQQPGRMRVAGQAVQIYRPTIRANKAAKPKVFLNTNQARQELAPAKVFDPRGRQTASTEAAAVQKRQADEKRILEATQAQEIQSLQLKRDQEAKRVNNASARAKVTKEYEVKITDLKKNHVVETEQITVRHKNDTEQVKKVAQGRNAVQAKSAPPDRKAAPPDKKKRID